MRKRSIRSLWGVSFALLLYAVPSWAGETTIAAASNLSFAFKEVISSFEKKTGDRVKLSLGSSGNFYAQIENGAPFDLFFSADVEYPKKLEGAGLIEPGTLYRYAIGRIVVWAPKESPVDVGKLEVKALLEGSVKKIAIANPKHAPYGRAAVEAMNHFNLYDRVKDKLVFGENVSQAAQFVESGAAELGIIPLSLALAPTLKERGRYWEVPETAHQPLEQAAVILKQAKNPGGARAFLLFLQEPEAREMMNKYGFTAPGR
ncbi:MAG TPA: molybdate ABC transporter substrate-binding protein [Candidatus Manganitrophaceae bacterium]|nr:molybdate ABC transporter substrate-binding protein [Candidatus Manganitrophaceae bacterium]